MKKAFEFLGKIASQLAQYSDRGVPRSVPGHLSGFLSTSSKQENSDTGTTATETGDRLIGLEEDFKVGQVSVWKDRLTVRKGLRIRADLAVFLCRKDCP